MMEQENEKKKKNKIHQPKRNQETFKRLHLSFQLAMKMSTSDSHFFKPPEWMMATQLTTTAVF